MRNYALSGGIASTEAAAGTFATEHLMSDYVKRNIYDAAGNALFDANGKLTAAMRAGYDDLDWQKAVGAHGSPSGI